MSADEVSDASPASLCDWIPLSQAVRRSVWDEFYAKFQFRPSVHPQQWPGICEPTPFRTYDITGVRNDPNRDVLETQFEITCLLALRKAVSPNAWLYAMDWQHQCYYFSPHQAKVGDWWAISALPDGDYHIFLSRDLAFGWFGHPWEETICVFGEPLVNTLGRRMNHAPWSLIRHAL
jgi:hypothetical protein